MMGNRIRKNRGVSKSNLTLLVMIFLLLFFLLFLPASICTGEGNKVNVFVSVASQKYFVQKIGGEFVTVTVMVQPGANPATYEPKPRQMELLSKAAVYFSVGVPFEAVWLDRLSSSNPDMLIVSTYDDIKRIEMAEGHDGHGSSPDPHIWTSPPLVTLQARTILTTLQNLNPENYRFYEENYNSFIMETVRLDARIRELLNDFQGQGFMVFHPSWGYFAKAYGLKQIPVEREGKAPKPSRLVELIDLAEKREIRTIFVQPQFSVKSAELIAKEIGGEVVKADPLAANWAENLMAVAEKMKTAMGREK